MTACDPLTREECCDGTPCAECRHGWVTPDAGAWDDVRCGLDRCGAPLYIERTSGLSILASFTANDLQQDEHTTSWSIVCQNGHTVLLPLDTGGDAARFGECAIHDDGEAHNDSCDDMARLRRVVLMPAPPLSPIEQATVDRFEAAPDPWEAG